MRLGLASVALWVECWPENQGVAGLIPSQGTCLGCGPGPQLTGKPINVSFTHPCFSPSLLPFPSF